MCAVFVFLFLVCLVRPCLSLVCLYLAVCIYHLSVSVSVCLSFQQSVFLSAFFSLECLELFKDIIIFSLQQSLTTCSLRHSLSPDDSSFLPRDEAYRLSLSLTPCHVIVFNTFLRTPPYESKPYARHYSFQRDSAGRKYLSLHTMMCLPYQHCWDTCVLSCQMTCLDRLEITEHHSLFVTFASL
jgi:hypothetical protein